MEAVVGAVAEHEGLLVVGALIHVVAFLVVDGGEVVGVDLDAHLYAEVVDVVDVPGGGVADDVAIAGLDELGALPEGVGQRGEAEGGVEALAVTGHGFAGGEVGGVEGVAGGIECGGEGGRGCGVAGGDLLFEGGFEVVHLEGGEFGVGGGDDVVDVAPLLGPEVAEEVGGDHAVGTVGGGAVFLDELEADVGVEFVVEGLELGPGALELGGELGGGHVVAGTPEVAGVLEAELGGALVGEVDEAGVLVAHGGRDGVPARSSRSEELFGVAGLGHDDAESPRCRDIST